MTHDELLADIKEQIEVRKELGLGDIAWSWNALRAVVELHKPRTDELACIRCSNSHFWIAYPCPTIQTIESALQ
jgi:hypothetical protein